MSFFISIINAGRSFRNHLNKLIAALRTSHDDAVQNELDEHVNIYKDYSIIDCEALSRWHHVIVRTYIDNQESSSMETKIGGGLFNTKKQVLDKYKIVTGKSLKYQSDNNVLCVEKEIRLYDKYQLNENDHIIEFHGYLIKDCGFTLFYDYADYDLFEFFQINHELLKDWKEKIKLAWKISQGVKYLHDVRIFIYLFIYLLVKYTFNDKYLRF